MTLFIAHRINTLEELAKIDDGIGLEIDIREDGQNIVLAHDPFLEKIKKIKLCDYLQHINKRFLVVNVKTERIEKKFLEISKTYIQESEYFFLDSTSSIINNFGRKNNYSFCSRYSEYESLQTSKNFLKAKLIKWIWIDVFNKLPIDNNISNELNKLQAKKCLTSPCLLNRKEDIKNYALLIKKYNLKIDAICCKYQNINLWKKWLI